MKISRDRRIVLNTGWFERSKGQWEKIPGNVGAAQWLVDTAPGVLIYQRMDTQAVIETWDLATNETKVVDPHGANQLVAGGGQWAIFSNLGYRDSHGTRNADGTTKPWFPLAVDDKTGDIAITLDYDGFNLHVWDGISKSPIMDGLGFAVDFKDGKLRFRLDNVWYDWKRGVGVTRIGSLYTLLGGCKHSAGYNLGWYPDRGVQAFWHDWSPQEGMALLEGDAFFFNADLRADAQTALVIGSSGAGELHGEQRELLVDFQAKTVNGVPWVTLDLTQHVAPPEPPPPPVEPPPVEPPVEPPAPPVEPPPPIEPPPPPPPTVEPTEPPMPSEPIPTPDPPKPSKVKKILKSIKVKAVGAFLQWLILRSKRQG